MNYEQEIIEKTEMVRVIAGSYLKGKLSLFEARESLSGLIHDGRPSERKAAKMEMANLLQGADAWSDQLKLQALFQGLLPLPLCKDYLSQTMKELLQAHNQTESKLMELDWLEEQEPPHAVFVAAYDAMEQQINSLVGMVGQVVSVTSIRLNPAILAGIQSNPIAAIEGAPYEFLMEHRKWMQQISNYIDLVETDVFPCFYAALADQKTLTSVWVEPHVDEISGDTLVMDLLGTSPELRTRFFNLDPELEGLKGPFGMEMLKEATVEMLAKSLNIPVNELLEKIKMTMYKES